jgi:uncharacterized protein (TIGR02265 family)
MEVRGIFFRALKEVFPHIGEIVGEDLGKYFEDIDAEGWYDAAPYLAAVMYLRERISQQVMVLIGNQLVETIKGQIRDLEATSPRELAERLPELYRLYVRGEGAGDWRVEEFAPGRAIIKETGITGNVDFSVGIIKSSLETVGAYNVRVAVIDDRAQGADANRFLAEWMEPDAG